MGRHHVRLLSELRGARLVGVHDHDRAVARAVSEEHDVACFEDLDQLADRVDAMVLSVPTAAHHELGCRLLRRGLHLLVEKPMASELAEADELLAVAGDRVLAVGHVEFYNPAVQALLGLGLPPRFLEIDRLSAFKPRSLDVDVVLDLMIHDLQILHALDPSPITEIRAVGINVLTERVDIANARLALESGCVANVTASRISAETVRKLRVFMPDHYYSVDYREQEVRGFRLERREGRRIRAHDPEVEKAEPLRRELEAFVAACRGERAPLVSGAEGRRALSTAIRVAEAVGGA